MKQPKDVKTHVSILVTGADGQVGRELQVLVAGYPNYTFHFVNRQALDITDAKAVKDCVERLDVDYCINCAAYTAVDKAESEAELAYAANIQGAGNVATACAQRQIPLLHISSDYVYHNGLDRPLLEDDATNPRSIYGQSKLEGDLNVLTTHSPTFIIRTSWVYSSFGHNFVRTMLRLGKERPALSVVYDQIGTPTYAADLAAALLLIVDYLRQHPTTWADSAGIYHYSNEGVTSWYDFAHAIFDLSGIDCQLLPILTKDYPTPAERPPFSLLDKSKIKQTFGLVIPHWRDSLRKCLEKLG